MQLKDTSPTWSFVKAWQKFGIHCPTSQWVHLGDTDLNGYYLLLPDTQTMAECTEQSFAFDFCSLVAWRRPLALANDCDDKAWREKQRQAGTLCALTAHNRSAVICSACSTCQFLLLPISVACSLCEVPFGQAPSGSTVQAAWAHVPVTLCPPSPSPFVPLPFLFVPLPLCLPLLPYCSPPLALCPPRSFVPPIEHWCLVCMKGLSKHFQNVVIWLQW